MTTGAVAGNLRVPGPNGAIRTQFLRRLAADVPALISLVVIVVLLALALAGPWLAPFDPAQQNLNARGLPPAFVPGGSPTYLLGTDHLGRDVLSRVLVGSRLSLVAGIAATLLSGLIGVSLGLLCGYHRGLLDEIVMRVADIQLSIPYVLFGITLLVVVGPSIPSLIAILALHSWVVYARIVRSQALSLRGREFVEACRALGAPNSRIIVRHLLPNVWPSVIVVSTFEIAAVIVLEGTLDFLGVGIQPPNISWGLLLAEGRGYLTRFWWITTFPGLALSVTVLAINLVGDWLRDLLDPRLKS